MARKQDAQYVVGRLKSEGRPLFNVAKFTGGDQPEATYQVTQIPMVHGERGEKWTQSSFMCNCPNSRSGRHIDDKHGLMVKDWIDRKEPKTGYYDNHGIYHKGGIK